MEKQVAPTINVLVFIVFFVYFACVTIYFLNCIFQAAMFMVTFWKKRIGRIVSPNHSCRVPESGSPHLSLAVDKSGHREMQQHIFGDFLEIVTLLLQGIVYVSIIMKSIHLFQLES